MSIQDMMNLEQWIPSDEDMVADDVAKVIHAHVSSGVH